MTGQLGALQHHFHRGAAIGVPKHHDERRAQEFHGIFEAGESVVIEEIAGKPHHEEIAGSLIEQELGRDAAVGAAEDRRDRDCASTRAARPTEKSFSSGSFAA
jgi:hypothetical protein